MALAMTQGSSTFSNPPCDNNDRVDGVLDLFGPKCLFAWRPSEPGIIDSLDSLQDVKGENAEMLVHSPGLESGELLKRGSSENNLLAQKGV